MVINKKKSYKKYSSRSYTKRVSLNRVKNGQKKSSLKIFKKLFFKMLFALLIVGAGACIVVMLFNAYNYVMSRLYSDERFFIDYIEITGCSNITETEIRNLIPFKIGDNLLRISLSDTKKNLQEQKPELKDISMSRNWKEKKVVISLKEREPEVFIYKDGIKAGIDFDNRPFPLRGNMFDMKIPVLAYSDEKERESLLKFYRQFKVYMKDFIPEITGMSYGDTEDIIFKINDKITVCWGQPYYKKIEEKASKIKLVLNDLAQKDIDAKYIDLSFIDNNKERVIVRIGELEELKI